MDKIQPTEAEIEVAKRFQTIGRALIYRKVSDCSKYNCYYADNYEYAGFHFDEPRGFFIQLELMQEILSLRLQLETAKEKVRTAVADYMQSEGCSCCRDSDGHKIHEKILAELLDAPMYGDGSGYDFRPFSTSELKKQRS